MTTIPNEPSEVAQTPRDWSARLLVKEMWASITIVAMWIAVAASAAWGGDLVTYSSGGSDQATIPAVIVVALLASLGTWPVAKYGFGDRR
jgi:multisubunit Na+/H+ antiporter MnhF subunit